ncbi:hypothetical protein TNCV_1870201 [Trichonephila clavipes]|nr:hypothetical protein TNCV_1870201 [Trichonephila clavipes]
MALWSRQPGSVFGCYGQIGLGGAERDFGGPPMRRDEGRVVDPPLVFEKGFFSGYESKTPCPGSRELERRALVGENLRRELKKGTWSEIEVEWKERR